MCYMDWEHCQGRCRYEVQGAMGGPPLSFNRNPDHALAFATFLQVIIAGNGSVFDAYPLECEDVVSLPGQQMRCRLGSTAPGSATCLPFAVFVEPSYSGPVGLVITVWDAKDSTTANNILEWATGTGFYLLYAHDCIPGLMVVAPLTHLTGTGPSGQQRHSGSARVPAQD